jgi:hypothetical protein
MALQGLAKRAYQARYMRTRRERDKAFSRAKALREERAMMRKALKRVSLAERWASENPGSVDERLLSLAYQWNQIAQEREEKEKNSKRVAV